MIVRTSGILLLFILRTILCIPLNQFYPFGISLDAEVARDDDNSSPRIFLQKEFQFFGQSQSSLFVNTNGVVSFGEPELSFRPQAFPLNGSQLISPFWADVDTRGTGTIWYRQTRSTELLSRASGEIRNVFPLQATQGYNATDLFIATWDHVGYYDRKTDRTNTFQCVLVTDEVQSFVIFLYADGEIQWTDGGGIPAQVGFNSGDGVNFAAVPASRTPDIINIDTLTNVDIPGVWIFQVNEERIVTANVPSGVVTHLDARIFDLTTVELQWGPVMDEEQNGNITSYNIYYRTNSSNSYTAVIRNVTDMEYNFTGLNMDTLYIFSVTAVNKNGESNVNAIITIRTGESIVPSAPPTNSSTNVTTNPPTNATTSPPTNATSNPPSNATTNPPSNATTNPPTNATTNPPTNATTNPPTNATTNPPTNSPTLSPVPAPTANTITVFLPHKILTREQNLYGVIVVTEQELSNTPERIIAKINGQLPPPYPGRDGVYTTAVWNNTEDVPLTFVVGDGEVTVSPDGTEYINKRLSECTTYGVFYYITLQSNNGHEDYGIVNDDYLSVEITDCFSSDDFTAVIVVAVVVFLLIFLIIIGVIICIVCGCTCLTCATGACLCECLQSKEKHNGKVSYKESGDVVLNLSDTFTTQSTQPSDEIVIQMLSNGKEI